MVVDSATANEANKSIDAAMSDFRSRAADFYVEGVPVATVAAYVETLLPGRGGIGRYPKDAKHPKRMTGWVHIDTQTNKSRWKG